MSKEAEGFLVAEAIETKSLATIMNDKRPAHTLLCSSACFVSTSISSSRIIVDVEARDAMQVNYIGGELFLSRR